MQKNYFDMKVPARPAPARPAPAPPPATPNGQVQRASSLIAWDDCNDPFFSLGFSAEPHFPTSQQLAVPKKKPPPRPPPPKLPQPKRNKQVPYRSSSLLSGLFSRRNSGQTTVPRPASSQDHTRHGSHPQNSLGLSLIDLHSPSSSPTPTSRSSSDGFSVRSFGSDNGHPLTSGNSSQFESGFEDDFDSFAASSRSQQVPAVPSTGTDPWCISPPLDPFSPPPQVAAPQPKQLGGFPFRESSDISTHTSPPPSSTLTVIKQPTISMPTIIRPKMQKSPTFSKVAEQRSVEKRSVFGGSSPSRLGGVGSNIFQTVDEDDDISDEGNWSPPMPSIPPPPPPVLTEVDDEEPPYLPPRPFIHQDVGLETPHGVALYDFQTSHPDDLSFKASDVIVLLRQVNSEWYYGRCGGQEGMFPATFVDIRVPLAGHSPSSVVKALYTFTPEATGDLGFREGAQILVLGRINDDWLYGELNGTKGQFPAAFVDRVPDNLPVHST